MADDNEDLSTPIKKKMGRPPWEYNLAEVEKLCRLNCTDGEVAAFFGVSTKTIQRERKKSPEFAEAMERGRGQGQMSLRRKQMEVALTGNTPMLIWLGKQVLGQRDKNDLVVEGGESLTPWSSVSAGVEKNDGENLEEADD